MARARAHALDSTDVLARAALVEALASVAPTAGRAAELLGAATALRGARVEGDPDVVRTERDVRGRLSPEVYDTAFERAAPRGGDGRRTVGRRSAASPRLPCMTNTTHDLGHLSVLISGAGVAGPALALNLQRYGARVTVVEKAPELRAGGFAVDFRGHVHRKVLTEMGIRDEIHARQTRMGRQIVVDADGSPKVDLPSEMMSGDVEILRGDLARIMYERTRARSSTCSTTRSPRSPTHPTGSTSPS